jgi:outer membrane protein assembly factor BamB
MKNGNQGFQDEVHYYSSPDHPITATGDLDADVLWRFDMRAECGACPHNQTVSNVLILGDRLFVNTSNGIDWTHTRITAPDAPALICLDKVTGKLLGEESSGISKNVLHASWSSPAYAEIGGHGQIIFGGGDGFCYGFDVALRKGAEGRDVFNELWRCDANPKRYRVDDTGHPRAHYTHDGPGEIIATPVFYKGKVYTLIGQDPESGEGAGCLSCIDPSGRGDLTGKTVWTCTDIKCSISTPAIVDDVIYAADYSGSVHALDVLTGVKLWTYDTKGHIWGASPFYIDRKIYIGNEEGELHIITAGRTGGKNIKVIDFPAPLYLPVVFANGTLFVTTPNRLYAFSEN